ncbi:MAG: hypothetical protein U0790_15355 [Isosphaeraceae bacterium]
MSATPFRLYAITRIERHTATQLVRRAISDAGGWITGFRQFSNSAVALDLEINPSRLPALYAAIEAAGIPLSPPCAEQPVPPPDIEDWQGALRLEFDHDEPDLIIPVPAVPG